MRHSKTYVYLKRILFVIALCAISKRITSQNDSVYFAGLAQKFKYYLKSDLDSAKGVAKKIEQGAKERQYKKGMGLGANYLGVCNLYESKYDTALSYFNQALKHYGEKIISKGLCDVYSNIGVCNDYLGNFSEAAKHYLKALKIAEVLLDENGISRACNNLGTIFYQQNNYKAALTYLERSLKIREQEKDDAGIASSCLNIGACYNELKQTEKGNYFLLRAIEGAKLIGDSILLADGLVSMAQGFDRLKDYKNAISYYNKAIPIYNSFNDSRALSNMYSFMAMAYGNLKEYKLHHQYFLISYKLAKGINYLEGVARSSAGLIISSAYLLKTDSVNFYLSEYGKVRDSIFSESNSKQVAEMQTKYETEKKDRELELKDVTIQKQTVESQKKSLQRNAFIVGFALMLGLSFFIYRGYRLKQKANVEINRQKETITHQKLIVEEKNKEITDSITYAQRIQRALLASKTILNSNLKEYFILFKPKDIVSGDFYWATVAHNKFYLVIADCTGHGVPGAFMSLLNISFLNEAINEKQIQNPKDILAHVRQKLIINLLEDGSAEGGKDGMDCSLLCFDFEKQQLHFSCAHNPIIVVRENELIQFAADRMPVGKSPKENEAFTETQFDLKKGDVIYALTDGYPDQFGGPKGKKFKHKTLTELLFNNASKNLEAQKQNLENVFDNWKGSIEQLDDVLVVGIKV